MKRILFCVIAAMCTMCALATTPADRIVGTYSLNEPETGTASKVRIYRLTDGTYQGKVVWISTPRDKNGQLYLDKNNPDAKLRTVPCNQVVMLRNFTYDAKNDQWNNGQIYNPANGKTYKALLKFETDSKLKVRGYIGVPALGQSMYWNKIVDAKAQ